jgi:hypothetical protein
MPFFRNLEKNVEEDRSQSTRLLRRLQEKLVNFTRSDAKSDFACFFLSSFIDDVFYNLAGDFPYTEELHEIILKIFHGICKDLAFLSKNLSNSDNSYFLAYEKLVQTYLDGLDEIRACCEKQEKESV